MSTSIPPICPECGKTMKNLGNISGFIYDSYPAQWDEVFVCETDKVKETIRKYDSLPPDYGHIKTYKEISRGQ